jgi:hypothetical protein
MLTCRFHPTVIFSEPIYLLLLSHSAVLVIQGTLLRDKDAMLIHGRSGSEDVMDSSGEDNQGVRQGVSNRLTD